MIRAMSPMLVASLAALGIAPTEQARPQQPSGRSCHSMAFSPRQAGIIVYGGSRVCGRDVLSDSALWLWSGDGWRRLANDFPGAREDVMLVADLRRGGVVLFGGRNGPTVHEDTWGWNGTAWRRLAVSGPGRVEHAGAAFDSSRGQVVLFGGGTRDGAMQRRTWLFDGTQWALGDSGGPAARVAHSMVSAPGNIGGVLLYGGFNAAGSFRDLWHWNGRRWSLVDSAGPADSEGPALLRLAGDTIALVSAHGAGSAAGAYRVWLWDGRRWIARGASGPPARIGQGAAYDPLRRRIVLFGGAAEGASQSTSDVWEFDGTVWRRAPD